MRMVCAYCDNRFDASEDDPRCPKCLRRRSAPEGKSRAPDVGDLSELSATPKPKRPFSVSLGRYLARATMGCCFFFLLTIRGTLLGMDLGGPGFRIYAVILGGLLLGGAWSIYPRLSPVFRE